MTETKILLMDIETSPNLSYVWGRWEQNVLDVERDWYMLCFVAKWYGNKKLIDVSLPDFKLFKKDKYNDREVVLALWKLFDEADIIIGHNGDKFDIKKANARFIAHGLPAPSPYTTIDTLKVARKYFKFDSNKLDELGRYLGVGRKIEHSGFQLWLDCMNGVKRAWKEMIAYNKQDVILLEAVYEKLKGWMTNHPNINQLDDDSPKCPTCGHEHLHKRGFGHSKTKLTKYQRYQCQNCFSWSRGTGTRTLNTIR